MREEVVEMERINSLALQQNQFPGIEWDSDDEGTGQMA